MNFLANTPLTRLFALAGIVCAIMCPIVFLLDQSAGLIAGACAIVLLFASGIATGS